MDKKGRILANPKNIKTIDYSSNITLKKLLQQQYIRETFPKNENTNKNNNKKTR